ncbi:NAC domain-containing protein 1 [Morus notabilis]|uniref:NAC domain-containing protein 1 n=1 Tax=Morus notabilis TaxID=981085 RepID=W9SKD6_9ROSA|nr:uncharacterized protein LOC21402535 isoform X2 [Morus notabilis]EXC13639.1 NAC domain-containing protein 1 [Morus notabilis]
MTISLPEDLPVGVGFRPTDEEIMNHYLKLKMIGKDSKVDNGIAEVNDVCTFDPWELPPKSKIKSKDQIWWFFTRRDPERKTTKRKTKTGSWGLTGEEGQIKGRDGRVLGTKKYVVFFNGPNRGRRSNWVIREYHPLPENVLPKQRHYVICRLEYKTDEKAGLTSRNEGEPSCNITSEVEIAPSAISEVHGHAEGNAESPSQLVFSPDDFLTEVEMSSIFEDCLNDDQKAQFVHENHPNPENSLPHQMPDLTCCLESKTDENSGTLGCNIGEPSIEIRAEIENPVAHAAISEVPGHGEGNAKVLSQPVLSPDDYLTAEDIRSIFSDGFNGGQKINSVMLEHHPELDNNLPQQMPDLTCCLESKTDENSGTLGCNIGEPSIEIRAEIENPVAHAAISEVPGHGEGNAKVLSPDDYLTAEDIRSIFSDGFNGGQKINSVMHEHHPELDSNLPQQWPYLTCCLENKTDESVGSLDCNIGRPSSNITSDIENQVAPTAIPVVHGDTEVNAELLWQTFLTPDHHATEKDISLILSNSLSDDHHNEWHALCGAAEPEMPPAEFLDRRKADSYENYYGESETTNDLFNNFIQPKSLKRPYFPDIPANNDMNAGGVDGRVKRPRSLALGECLQ